MSRKNTFSCPNCQFPLIVELVKPPATTALMYDPNDAVQKAGFDCETANVARGEPPFEKNPYAHGSDEFYRFNRGMRFVMGR